MSGQPSSGDQATAVAINNLVSAVFATLVTQPGNMAGTFLTMLSQMNDGLLGPGPFRDQLSAGVEMQRSILEQMQRMRG